MSLSNLQVSALGALLVAGASGLAVCLTRQDDDPEAVADRDVRLEPAADLLTGAGSATDEPLAFPGRP